MLVGRGFKGEKFACDRKFHFLVLAHCLGRTSGGNPRPHSALVQKSCR